MSYLKKKALIRAMEAIEEAPDEFSCNVLRRAVRSTYALDKNDWADLYSSVYTHWLAPRNSTLGGPWLHVANDRRLITRKEFREWRKTALAFLYTLNEAGDL